MSFLKFPNIFPENFNKKPSKGILQGVPSWLDFHREEKLLE